MAKKKPISKRQRLRNRIGNTPADSVQASIRGDIAQLRRMALAQAPMALEAIPKHQPLNPTKFGATGADIQFGEAIRELKRAIRGQEAQAPVNLARTAELFGGAQRSFEAAKANNQRSAEAGIAEQTVADAAIAASMGGPASEAAAALAQAGSANQGFLRGLKVSNESFDARNVAEAAAQGAKAQTIQAAEDRSRMAELTGDLGDKQTQRGLAAVELAQQARDVNWQRRMQQMEAEMNVRGFNRQGRESRFAQLSSLPALKLSALMASTQMTGAEADILNALDAPSMARGGGGGSGTPRLANGMTPGEYGRLMLSRDKALMQERGKASKEVQARRQKYFDDLTTGLSAKGDVDQDEETADEHLVRTPQAAIDRAVALARARGLDMRKPVIQNMMLEAITTSVPGWDRNNVAALLAQRLPVSKRKSKPKPVSQRRRSGR